MAELIDVGEFMDEWRMLYAEGKGKKKEGEQVKL